MFCIHCGQKMPDYGQFCPRCGRPAIKPDQANESAEASVANEVNRQNTTNSNTSMNQSISAEQQNRQNNVNHQQSQQAQPNQQAQQENPYQQPQSTQQQPNNQNIYNQPNSFNQPHSYGNRGAYNQPNINNQANLYNQGGSYNQEQNQQGAYGQRNPYGNAGPYHQGPGSYQQQAYSQQGPSQQGHANQAYSNQGYTNQGYSNQGYANQEYSRQGYSQQQQAVFEWQMGPWIGSKDIWSVFKDCMTVQFKDFSGRATRAEYLRFTLVMYSIFFLVELIVYGFDITALQNISYYVMLFVFMVPTYAVTVRRLHDSGLSGFWVLMEVPNSLVEILIGPNEPGRLVEPFTMIASFMSLILFFVCLRRSQIFTNEYGPLPDFTKYVKQ